MGSTIRAAFLATCTLMTLAMPAGAWDYPGHRIVGAVADLVLPQHHPVTQGRARELLERRLPDGVEP
jgi:hypothetical protein